jgi:hypothetical protein
MVRDLRPVRATAALAERVWRWPLVLAAVLMVAAGPAQAAGQTSAVLYASLLAVALAAVAVPVGLLALLTEESSS